MGFVTQVKMGDAVNPVASSLVGICSTEADESTKVVYCPDFTKLVEGVTIRVFFEYGNTAEYPHMIVNGTDKCPILKYGNEPLVSEYSWHERSIFTFTYWRGDWYINDYQIPVELIYDSLDSSLFIGRRNY